MKKIDHFCVMISFLIVAMVFGDLTPLHAQRASAEFLSSIKPTSLETGQEVKDGIQNVTYKDDILYAINVWAGIQVVDVSDREKPKEIGKYSNEHRAHNLYIDDRYGYLSDELAGVHILDISNPAVITKVAGIETEGNAFWVVAEFPYVYVAEEEKGVTIYDIANPDSPIKTGNYDTPGWAWELILRDNILYVSDKSGGLQILDVTDKSNPKRIGQYTGPKNARSISLENNYLYLANGAECICVIDINNPKFPTLIKRMSVEGYIVDVFPSGKNLFIANETKMRMEIIDVSSLPELKPGGSYQAEDKIYGLWKDDVYVFVAANSQSLILRYNSPPRIAAIPDTVLNEQQIITITAQAYDPDGDILYYEIENMPEGAVFDTLKGTLSWTPTFEQSGLYSDVTIRVIEYTDSRLTDEKKFSITVNHVNRHPSLPEVDDQIVKENEVLTITVLEGLDEDKEDTGKLLYSVENLPEGAVFDAQKRVLTWAPTFVQSGTYVLDFVISDQAGGFDRDASTITVHHVDRKPVLQAVENKTVKENVALEFVVTGSDPDEEDQNAISFEIIGLPEGASFDPATQKFKWIPDYENSGVYENLLIVMRAGNMSDSTTVNVTVNHVNRLPVIEDVQAQVVDENTSLTFVVSGSDPDIEDDEKLKFSASNLPEGAKFNPDSLKFTWTPSYEQSGVHENIVFVITDPSGENHSKTMQITVNHVNRPPVLSEAPPRTVNENIPLTLDLQGLDPDAEDQNSLQYSANQLPPGAILDGTQFTWTPTFDQSGEYTIEFSLSDGNLSDMKPVTFVVVHVNRPPVLEPIEAQVVDENKPFEIKITGNDPDTEDTGKWVLSAGQLPEGSVFNSETSTITWTPTHEQSGNYTLVVTNTDPQGQTAKKEIALTVNHINRTPALNPIEAHTAEENMPINIVIAAGEDPDVEDAQKLVYAAENLPDGATFDAITRNFNWTPTYEQSGTYQISISLSDDEFTVKQNLALTITHVNRAPTIEEFSAKTTDENSPFTISIVVADPDKEDEGKLQTTASDLPQGMTFNAANGDLSWTPAFDQAGPYPNIMINVKDPAGLEASRTLSVTVNNVNRPPSLAGAVDQTTTENSPVSVTLQGTDPDQEDEGKLKYSAQNLPDGATIDPASGTLNWTPGYTQAGSYSITASVADAEGLTAETTISITITDVNRLPQLQPVGAKTIKEDENLSFSLSATDEDTDNELTYSIDNLPDGASLDASNGSFSWTPEFDRAGNYSLSAKVSDGQAESSTTISITVTDVNRTPEISGGGSTTITVGETATLGFSATDPDGDNLTFESNDLPDGASLNAGSGNFSWAPSDDQTGDFSFTVQVTDGKDSAETTGRVTVNPKPEPPPADQPPQN